MYLIWNRSFGDWARATADLFLDAKYEEKKLQLTQWKRIWRTRNLTSDNVLGTKLSF